MRIVGGNLKGRVFNPPANFPARPTTDLAKESLMNILDNRVVWETLTVLDLFGGTGNISFELLSRGVKQVTTVEKAEKCFQFIKKQSQTFGFNNHTVVKADVFSYIKKETIGCFNLIFCDPPYADSRIAELPNLIFENKRLVDNGLLVIEHGNNLSFSKSVFFVFEKKYGQSTFSFFEQS